MRALVMDFSGDTTAHDITDQFMFGPALMVNPVTKAGATDRRVYLPGGASWYDFWTGTSQRGGRTVTAIANLEDLPLYVRAGSIIPMGPELQWASEKPGDPIELRIYPDEDGDFTLYEDDGSSYAYEKGEHAIIKFHWNDARQLLTISPREGAFPGMLPRRKFHIVLVGKEHGVGGAFSRPDRELEYTGVALSEKITPRP